MVIELSKVRGVLIFRDKQSWKLNILTLKIKEQQTFETSATIYQSTQKKSQKTCMFNNATGSYSKHFEGKK